MRWRDLGAIVALVSGVSVAERAEGSSQTVYVNCGAAPGGDGSQGAPIHSITAALPIAEALAAVSTTTIDVTGTCTAETFPIRLSFTVHLRGKRLPKVDGQGFPVPDQWRDTVIVRPTANPAPLSMVLITADGTRVSQISLDGQVPMAPDGVLAPAQINPTGIYVQGADGFLIAGVRIANVGSGVRTEDSTGWIVGNYLGPTANTSLAVNGGPTETTVVVLNNRAEYRVNGIGVAGGIGANPATGTVAGTTVTAHVWRNSIVTTFTDTAPTNPAAVRVAAMVGNATDGDTKVTFLYNQIGGPTRYSLIIFAGPQVVLGGGPYTGTIEGVFHGTALDAAATATALAVITFTNTRATIWPDPRYLAAEYMQDAVFDLWHDGDLDTALVDHPQFSGGIELGNVLLENGEPVPYGTFVVTP